MRIHSLIAALLTVSALALVACGEDPTGGGPTADQEQKMRDAQLAFARCMREHGIDMDDPKPGERGIRLAIPKGVTPEKAEAANEACRKHLDAIKPPELSEEQEKQARDAALAHARCMREHGIDFPDPTFGENGEATIRIGKDSGIEPDDPKFQKAQEECAEEAPGLFGGEAPETNESSP
jgi:hypothetical protein